MSLQVILVDDDDMVIYLHKMLTRLSGLAADPLCFGDGKSALEYLTTQYQPGTQYLVLLDLNMPFMDGWEFLRLVQTRDFADSLSVVLVTSSIDQADRDQAREFKQVISFVEKPLNIATCRQIMDLPELRGRMETGAKPQNTSL
ncbi:MAG: response regulator [Adhaeribacter sp.]